MNIDSSLPLRFFEFSEKEEHNEYINADAEELVCSLWCVCVCVLDF